MRNDETSGGSEPLRVFHRGDARKIKGKRRRDQREEPHLWRLEPVYQMFLYLINPFNVRMHPNMTEAFDEILRRFCEVCEILTKCWRNSVEIYEIKFLWNFQFDENLEFWRNVIEMLTKFANMERCKGTHFLFFPFSLRLLRAHFSSQKRLNQSTVRKRTSHRKKKNTIARLAWL